MTHEDIGKKLFQILKPLPVFPRNFNTKQVPRIIVDYVAVKDTAPNKISYNCILYLDIVIENNLGTNLASELADSVMDLLDFKTFYIDDLNNIQFQGGRLSVLESTTIEFITRYTCNFAVNQTEA